VTAVRIGEVLAANLAQLPRGWWRSFDPGLASHTGIVLVVLAGLAVLGWLPRLRLLHLDALFLLAYLAMILLWPHPAHMRRFLYVVLPLGLVYAQLACAVPGRCWPGLGVLRA